MVSKIVNSVKATVGFTAPIGYALWCSVFDKDKLKNLFP